MRAIMLLAGVLAAGTAHAGPPRYDVEKYCQGIAGFTGEYSEMLYGACFEQEQGAYNGLKADWPNLPPAIASYCDGIARFTGEGFYMLLQSCIAQERSAAGANSSKKFRY